MRMDRAEWTGTGAAVLFHVALIGALSLSLAHVASVPEPPAMDVEFVEDVGLTSAAPQSVVTPPPPSQAPEIGEAEPVEPVPVIQPKPQPSIVPAPAKPRPTPTKPAPRASRIGSDFLKGIENDNLAPRAGPSRSAAPTFSAAAQQSIGQAIARQIQPCADQQPYIGEGANQVRLKINLRLARSGRLIRPPAVIAMSGDGDLRAKYGDLLEDQVRRIFAACSPLRLPAELYDTPTGGWSNININYNLP